MYFHQLYEDLRNTDIPEGRERLLFNTLNSCQRFNIGRINDYEGIATGATQEMIKNSMEHLRMPYNHVYIDYRITTERGDNDKIATVVVQRDDKKGIPSSLVYNFCYSIPRKRWCIFRNIYKLNDDGCTIYDFDSHEVVEPTKKNQFAANTQVSYLAIAALSSLLMCKNIGIEEIAAPYKVNKKRKKRGKIPIYTYKVLVVKDSKGPRTKYLNGGHGESNRVHLCRGHFKTYTEQNKLFGKYTGQYWWQPHARGDKSKGVVVKDYKVTKN